MTAFTVVSGQTITISRTALDIQSQVKTDFEDSAYDFKFVDDHANTWAFTMGSWVEWTCPFVLTVPQVATRTTLTLTRLFDNVEVPCSPETLVFDTVPAYKGKFQFSGASFVWDCTVFNPGTDSLLFDFMINGHYGTNSDGVTPFPCWFTHTSQYRTTHGGPLTTLGRNIVSVTQDQGAGGYPSNFLGLIQANGRDIFTTVDTSTEWGITIQGTYVRKNSYNPSDAVNPLITFAFHDPTNHGGNFIGLTLQTYEDRLSINCNGNGFGSTVYLADSSHLWDDSYQIIHLALVIAWNADDTGTLTLYVNGEAKITGPLNGSIFNGYYNTPVLNALSTELGVLADGFGVMDFMVHPVAQSQPTIAANAAAWGLS